VQADNEIICAIQCRDREEPLIQELPKELKRGVKE
jgi:hypothetical protein